MIQEIYFEPKAHRYYNEKNETYISATQLVELFVPKFEDNKEFWLYYKTLQQLLGFENDEAGKDAYKAYLKSVLKNEYKYLFQDKNILLLYKVANLINLHQDVIISTKDKDEEWKDTNKKALVKGTNFHNAIEAAQLGSPTYKFEHSKNKVNVIKDFSGNLLDIKNNGIIPELRIYNHKYKIAGTSDQPYFELPWFDINDWKGLALDTPMLTSEGWKIMGSLNKGDKIYSGEGKLTTILNVSEVHYNPCYKIIFDTNEEIVCDHEHKWELENGIFTTEEMFKMNSKKLSISIPHLCQEEVVLPIDPYVFGLYLADGNRTCGTITCINEAIWEEVKNRGYEISDNHNRKTTKAESRTVYGIRRHLEKLGVLNNKHIPPIYLKSSHTQRLDLLRGFMDGDGYFHRNRKRCSIQTTKQWQADAFITLLSSLGIKPTVFKTKGIGFAGEFDKFDICFTSKENPFLIRNQDYEKIIENKKIKSVRKIKSIEKIDMVPTKCLEVEADCHTYLAGTGLIKTHNTNKEIKTTNRWATMKHCLSHLEDCVKGDTKLITKTGLEIISEVVGKEIEIWNGEKWSKVIPFQTGVNRQLYRVNFNDGSFLDVTSKHKFLIKYRLDKEFEEQTTEQILQVMNKTKWKPRVPNSKIIMEEGLYVIESYDWGFILGDGNVHNNVVKAELHNEDKKLKFSNCKKINIYNGTTVAYFDLDAIFGKQLKYQKGLPKVLFTWDRQSILKFIAGWLDADGSLQGNSVRLYGEEDKLRDAQLLLTKCGIKSSIKLVSKKGSKTNLGIRKKDLWYCHISKTDEIPTQRLKPLKSQESSKLGKWQIITNIQLLPDLHNTYCLTEKDSHTCVFNNVLTKQCNFNHYNIQLSLYAWMLEQYGYRCRNIGITHIVFSNDDNPSHHIYYPMKYLKKEIENMLEYYDKHLRNNDTGN